MTITPTMRALTELDCRLTGGLDISLLWSPEEGSVYVTVTDDSAPESFTFEVDAADARDAFLHPFAYAAAKRVPYASARRAPVYA